MKTTGHVSETYKLEVRVRALEVALETAIVWIAQSAVGVLSPDEAGRILKTMKDTVNGQR